MTDSLSTGPLTVTAPAELVHPTAEHFAARLHHLPAEGDLVIDLRRVDYLDSSGLQVLLAERSRRHRAGGTLAVRHASPLVLRLLEATGADQLLVVLD